MLEGLFKNVFFSLLYFAAALLGLSLADSPGIASPIWPPAGIALAGALLCGPLILPGIFIGAVSANLYNTFTTFGDISTTSIFVASSIGVGAILQAFFGAFLIKKYSNFPDPLEEIRSIFALLFYGGFIACTMNATVGNLTLLAAGFISASEVAFSWVTWWAGDAMAVAVFCPTVLLLLGKELNAPTARKVVLTSSLLVVFTVSSLAFVGARTWEDSEFKIDFELQSAKLTSSFEQQIQVYNEIIQATDRFISLNKENLGFEEFRFYIKGFLENHPEIRALSWNPKILDSDRKSFEDRMRTEGFPDFQIRQSNSAGEMSPSPKRDVYFPVAFIYPVERNEPAIGHDTYFVDSTTPNPRIRALESARDEGVMRATERITIVQEKSDEYGLIAFHPVFFLDGMPKSVEARNSHLAGYVAAVFLVKDMIEATLDKIVGTDSDVIVSDLSSQDGNNILYDSRTDDKKAMESQTPIKKNQLETEKVIEFAGRKWNFHMIESPTSLASRVGWTSWIVLLSGLIFTLLTTILVLVLTGQTEHTKKIVKKRTEELDKSRVDVINHAKLASLGMMAAGIAHEINNPLAIIQGQADGIETRVKKDIYTQEHLLKSTQTIKQTIQRIASIIQGLRRYSRDESDPKSKIVLVSTIIENTLSLCRERFKSHGIELKVDAPDEKIKIVCREVEISQVLINLLNNSFHAIERMPEKWIHLEVEKSEREIVFSVKDSGKGIGNEHIDQIFDPFYTTKPVDKGTGLGLSISEGIVSSHDGKIWYDNSDGNTCFCFSLPLV